MQIVLYSRDVRRITGLQTFEKIFCKKLCNYFDITYVYDVGDQRLIDEVAQFVKVVRNTGQMFIADICIYSSIFRGQNGINVNAGKYIQICHSDFEAWGANYEPTGIDLHVSVSDVVAESLKRSKGIDSIVIPNMLDSDIHIDKVLTLVTASRIAKGKGFERMVRLARMLKLSGKKFIWLVCGTGSRGYIEELKYNLSGMSEFIFLGPRDGIYSYMNCADYVVQLSDNEGFCYSIHEALQIGKPVIVTDWAGVRNTVKNGENGYILDMDLTDVDVDQLYTSIPTNVKLDIPQNESTWLNLLHE